MLSTQAYREWWFAHHCSNGLSKDLAQAVKNHFVIVYDDEWEKELAAVVRYIDDNLDHPALHTGDDIEEFVTEATKGYWFDQNNNTIERLN